MRIRDEAFLTFVNVQPLNELLSELPIPFLVFRLHRGSTAHSFEYDTPQKYFVVARQLCYFVLCLTEISNFRILSYRIEISRLSCHFFSMVDSRAPNPIYKCSKPALKLILRR